MTSNNSSGPSSTVGDLQPVKIESETAFNEFIQRDGMTLVHFSATWCESCTQLNQIFKELLVEYPGIFTLGVLDAEGLAAVTQGNKVTAVPTVLFFKAGKLLDRLAGFHPAELRSLIVQHSFYNQVKVHEGTENEQAATIRGPNADTNVKESLEDRLKRLINRSRLMLFMKGSTQVPKCGFSRQIIQILRDANASFETFDILQDEAVRQGLKSYSDWPTYPQLYLDGELLGGLDVIREEMKSNEFVAKLPKAA